MSKKSLISGISILGIAGLICKIVGVLYRIPLANIVGGEGLGLYQQVFPAYNLLLTLTSAGIPVAISRMVSHYITLEKPGMAKRVFHVALGILTILGILSCALMLVLSGSLARWVGTPEGRASYMCIAPSLLLVCIMSAFRGYMQGTRRMMPTAISQLIEQVGKVALALPLAALGMNRGGWSLGAAGALLGTSIAEGVAVIYMMIDYAFKSRRSQIIGTPETRESKVAGSLIRVAVPITLGACIVPLAGTIDSAMLKNLLMAGGLSSSEAGIRYGLYSGLVLTMINVPTAIAMAMSTNLVPDIASGRARGDADYVRSQALTGLKVGSLVGFPCSVGMSLLAEPILFLCYGGSRYTAAQLHLTASLLQVSALTIILFTLVQVTSGILQGAGRQKIPMYTLMAGVACKIALNYVLVGIPSIGIAGAPVASIVCYSVSLIPNLVATCSVADMHFPWKEVVCKPLICALLMGIAVFAVWHFGFGGIPSQGSFLSRLLPVLACMFTGIVIYVLSAVLTGSINRELLPARFRALSGRRKNAGK